MIAAISVIVILTTCLYAHASDCPGQNNCSPREKRQTDSNCATSPYFFTTLQDNFTLSCSDGHIMSLESCRCFYQPTTSGAIILEDSQCEEKGTLTSILDRRWRWTCGGFELLKELPQKIECRQLDSANIACSECPHGHVVTALETHWYPKTHTRSWNMTCTPVKSKTLYDCYYTGYVNVDDDYVNVTLKPNQVFRSMVAFKDPQLKDWKFAFTACSQCPKPRISVWSEWTSCCSSENRTTRVRLRQCSSKDFRHPRCGCNVTLLREEEACKPINCETTTTVTAVTTLTTETSDVTTNDSDVSLTPEINFTVTTSAKVYTTSRKKHRTTRTTRRESPTTTEKIGEFEETTTEVTSPYTSTSSSIIVIVTTMVVVSLMIIGGMVVCLYKTFVQNIQPLDFGDTVTVSSYNSATMSRVGSEEWHREGSLL